MEKFIFKRTQKMNFLTHVLIYSTRCLFFDLEIYHWIKMRNIPASEWGVGQIEKKQTYEWSGSKKLTSATKRK